MGETGVISNFTGGTCINGYCGWYDNRIIFIFYGLAEAAGAVDHIDGRFAFPAAGAIVGRADGSAVCIAGVAVWDQLEDAEICSAGQHSGAGGADRLSQFLIPDRLLVTGLLAYIPLNLLCGVSLAYTLVQGLLGGCSVAVPLLLVVLVADAVMQQETMGGGDIKLFFLLGVYLGPLLTVFTLFAACVLGLAGQLAQQKLEPGKAFPFGPFIALAVWPVLLWGTSFAQWYLQLF